MTSTRALGHTLRGLSASAATPDTRPPDSHPQLCGSTRSHWSMCLQLLATLALVAAAPLAAQQAPGVIVATARIVEFPLTVEALGNALANESVEIRPKLTETIAAVRFAEGTRVEAGSVLVELQNTEALAAVAGARAAYAESSSQLRRAQELARTRAVSAAEIEQLSARRDANRAGLDAANSRLAEATVRAPFAGRVGLRRVSPGSLVGPDTIITTLDDTDTIKLDFAVPEARLAQLQPGLTVEARSIAWPDQVFEGVVASVDTRVDPVSRSVTVRAHIPNPNARLRPGMFLTVTLLNRNVQTLMIPEQAIVPEQSRQFVFVVDNDGVVHKREVRTGRRRPGEVEVLDGLTEGEQVITEGTQRARPGNRVTVLRTLE